MTDRCEVCGAPEEHFDAASCVEYLKERLAEFAVLVTVEPGKVGEDVNVLRNLLRKSMYLTRKMGDRVAELELRLEYITTLVDGELPSETHAAVTYITIRKIATGEEVIGRRG